jgi:DMSO reductase family type II enzyme heme b subunit
MFRASEVSMIHAAYVADAGFSGLLDPDGASWRGARSERIALTGTPLGLQPTDAIRVAWAKKKIGAVAAVDVAARHDGRVLAMRLEWDDADENREIRDTTVFPDGAAVVFPAAPDAPMVTMGAPGKPVNAWYWRADESDRGRDVVAEGIGSSRTLDRELVHTSALWKEGRWHVIIARALRVEGGEPVAQLEPGTSALIGIAVWEGGHGERAGIKSFSGDWQPLVLAAPDQARR